MIARKFYRDGLEEEIVGTVRVRRTRDGHTVESYTTSQGAKRFFVTLAGTHFCAHGDTLAEAVADAIWKDPARRPDAEQLQAEIVADGPKRKITLNEFRLLTGACLTGCKAALEKAGLKPDPMTATDIRDKVSREWGQKLLDILGIPKEGE